MLSAALESSGMPIAWRHRIVGAPILQYFKTFGHLLRKDGLDPTSVQGAADDYFPYDIPNVYVDYVNNNPGVPSGFWRSVGNSQNGFILESFVDELAHAAGKDPYEYRRGLLGKQLAAIDGVWSLWPRRRAGASLSRQDSIAVSPRIRFGSFWPTYRGLGRERREGEGASRGGSD